MYTYILFFHLLSYVIHLLLCIRVYYYIYRDIPCRGHAWNNNLYIYINRESWKSCYHYVTIFTTHPFIVMIMIMMYYDVMYKFHSALFKKIASAATGSKNIRSIKPTMRSQRHSTCSTSSRPMKPS